MTMQTMQAIVIQVRRDHLLVFDLASRQRVIVHTNEARRFRPNDIVRIRYSGVMTSSIPPQIFARNIILLSHGGNWCHPCC